MATKVIMPKQGLQMTHGTIISWLAKEGETVEEGKPLFEMETDKLTIEIAAPVSGKLLKIIRFEGDVVPITELIAVIGDEGDDISDILAGGGSLWEATASGESAGSTVKAMAETSAQPPGERTYSSPRARMRAQEIGIELNQVAGSGPEGLIIERDVLAAAESAPKATPLAQWAAKAKGLDLQSIAGSGPRGKIYQRDLQQAGRTTALGEDRLVKLSGMRRVIAQRMRDSLDSAAQAVHRIDVDMSEVVRLRTSLKSAEILVSFNDLILKTVAQGLRNHPRMNSRFTQEGILEVREVNIGMAVAVAVGEGLLVPVIRNADCLDLAGICSESRRLAEAARSNRLAPEAFQGGTFSVSNLGMYGLDSFTAIINSPESGILAVGGVKEKPVAVDGSIVVRPMCCLSLTYDHRIIDGAPAADFLRTLKVLLENPYRLL